MAARPVAPAASCDARPAFCDLPELANAQVGGKVLFATDEWFAGGFNMLSAHAPEWKEGVFSDCGKWMDGWCVGPFVWCAARVLTIIGMSVSLCVRAGSRGASGSRATTGRLCSWASRARCAAL